MPGSKLVFKGLQIVSAYGDWRLVSPVQESKRGNGIPPGGPFDRLSFALANALAGHSDEKPAVEIALGPTVFEATEPGSIVVVGGPNGSFPLLPGARFEVRPIGARAYVSYNSAHRDARLAGPPSVEDGPIRVLKGPQSELLDIDRFLSQTYRVGFASNRVGLRLEGEALSHTLSLPSEPAIPGVIQIPPNGQPIVLGPDGPTIGGYPKIAVVIDADFDRLARFRPGDSMRFRLVDLDKARHAAELARQEIRLRTAELRLSR